MLCHMYMLCIMYMLHVCLMYMHMFMYSYRVHNVGLLYMLCYVTCTCSCIPIEYIIHVMLCHMYIFMYSYRVHNVGLLVLFMHDIGDVTLELSKTILYFKTRNGVDHKLPEVLANCSFVIFVLEW